eukprot:GILJ01009407.1.p1 GENE.GILJ01009407.1~~GILJ01009407.1.p1  ORF type:complete len:856 (-),score=129.57 GILJ01009407.1:122-2689(-)
MNASETAQRKLNLVAFRGFLRSVLSQNERILISQIPLLYEESLKTKLDYRSLGSSNLSTLLKTLKGSGVFDLEISSAGVVLAVVRPQQIKPPSSAVAVPPPRSTMTATAPSSQNAKTNKPSEASSTTKAVYVPRPSSSTVSNTQASTTKSPLLNASVACPVPAPRVDIPSIPSHGAVGAATMVNPAFLQDSRRVKSLLDSKLLAVDCEGVNLSKEGSLTLVQIACQAGVFIFDILEAQQSTNSAYLNDMVTLLRSLFDNEECVKVFHDCRRDTEALLHHLGITVKHIVDTQVVFALIQEYASVFANTSTKHSAVVQRTSKTKSSCGRIGFNALLKQYNLSPNSEKDRVHDIMQQNPKFWSIRPLTMEMISYATQDVQHLLPLYDKLMFDLEKSQRQYLVQLSMQHAASLVDQVDTSRCPRGVPLKLTFENKDGVMRAKRQPVSCEDGSASFESDTAPSNVSAAAASSAPSSCSDSALLSLLSAFPEDTAMEIQNALQHISASVLEIVFDMGRPITLRLDRNRDEIELQRNVDDSLMKTALKKLAILKNEDGDTPVFTSDNRLGLNEMLHRISAIRNNRDAVCGLTYRVGRHIGGVSDMIMDMLSCVVRRDGSQSKSLLLLGVPGVGKTTLLRDVTKTLADRLKQTVIVVDTSNEIAGDGDISHDCIGRARRMPVRSRAKQHEVLTEAVQNHTPQCIVIDEISTGLEVSAAKTIAQRGVAMVATAHGIDLHSLMKNPVLVPLIGGLTTVTLGDLAAAKNGSNKTKLERAGAATFDMVIELVSRNKWRVYHSIGPVIDALLAGAEVVVETRWLHTDGNIYSSFDLMKKPSSSVDNGAGQDDWFDSLLMAAAGESNND